MSKQERIDKEIIIHWLVASVFLSSIIAYKDYEYANRHKSTYELIDTKKFERINHDRSSSIDWNDLETSEEIYRSINKKAEQEQNQKEKP